MDTSDGSDELTKQGRFIVIKRRWACQSDEARREGNFLGVDRCDESSCLLPVRRIGFDATASSPAVKREKFHLEGRGVAVSRLSDELPTGNELPLVIALLNWPSISRNYNYKSLRGFSSIIYVRYHRYQLMHWTPTLSLSLFFFKPTFQIYSRVTHFFLLSFLFSLF